MKRFITILLLTILFLTVAYSEISKIKKIQQAIDEKGANWTAGENWVTRLSEQEREKLFNYKKPTIKLNKSDLHKVKQVQNLPSDFDWRDKDGKNWVTAVRNQGNAGTCWAFSTLGQVEAWWKIKNSKPDSAIDLSEQFLVSCNESVTANQGYNMGAALSFIISQGGVPTEACFPYSANDAPCSNKCSNWQDDAVSIPDWGYITSNIADVETIKNAVYQHPVSASYIVYEDFSSYSGGVYEHTWGDAEGGHGVLITGWIDSLECWIVKNSWGNWGDAGYFKIKWGECDFGEYSEFVYDNSISGDKFNVYDHVLEISIEPGDSTTRTTAYRNNDSSTILEYASTINYNSNKLTEFNEKHFHVDDYNAYDGKSWWCGDASINGYDNHWLDYLETPIIDISSTTSPNLSFKGYWAIESPSEEPPYDGWDGCNVWISTDGGENFSVIQPLDSVYDCQHLWSFGHPGQGWGMGTDIAGWTGTSGGWIDVNFDLTSHKSDSAMIRFAFASDLAYCVTDDASLKGYFIDDVLVSDGATTIYSDSCGDGTNMVAKGMSSSDHSWLTIQNGAGTISQNASKNVTYKINAKDLKVGNYSAVVRITTNAENGDTVLINLEVTDTPSEIDENQIVESYKLEQNYPNPFNPITNINYSINSNKSENVKLIIYDLLGKKVTVLVDEMQVNGDYKVQFDGSDYSSGIYFYRISIGNEFSDTKKMVFLK
ncbi:MAG: C1 family peptidase [Candidatus Marinimicrobia bacterium]|nr:C1 family peptidase [Candidatus Neomarinimicrobiota bacterium]